MTITVMWRSRAAGVLRAGLGIYLAIALFLAAPYFNWQYAQHRSFVEWLLLGQVVPTAKAAAWPYFAFLELRRGAGAGRGAPATPSRPLTAADIYRRVAPNVVTITAYDSRGGLERRGSGFVSFDPSDDPETKVVTARHVLQGAARAEVTLQSGERLAITSVLVDNAREDLVIALATPPRRKGVLDTPDISTDLPQPGDRIAVVAAPLGYGWSVSDGVVSAVLSMQGYPIIQFTAAISPGSSGGPVLNERGQIVGLVVGSRVDGQQLNFAVPMAAMWRVPVLDNPVALARWGGPRPKATTPALASCPKGYRWDRATERAVCR